MSHRVGKGCFLSHCGALAFSHLLVAHVLALNAILPITPLKKPSFVITEFRIAHSFWASKVFDMHHFALVQLHRILWL